MCLVAHLKVSGLLMVFVHDRLNVHVNAEDVVDDVEYG